MSKVVFKNTIKKYTKNIIDPEEKKTVEILLDNIENNKDFFVRKKVSGKIDIAASVLLLSEDLENGLFLFHKKIQKWTMPGGHADGETDLHKVALTELKEEVGIIIEQKKGILPVFTYKFDYSPEVFGYKKSIINLFYIETCPVSQIPKIMEPDKCEELRWMSLGEVKKLAKKNNYKSYLRLAEVWDSM